MKSIGHFLAVMMVCHYVSFAVAVDEEMRAVADANHYFTTRFTQYLHDSSPNNNIVFSPVSASTVLAGLAQGAGGKTRSQLLSALGLKDDDQIIRKGHRSIISSYSTTLSENVTLKMANAFFVAKQIPVKESFLNVMQSDFKSEVQPMDFADSSAADTLNGWASHHTNGLINNIYGKDSLSNSTLLVLLNAVYFKGTWKVSFRESYTSKQPFYLNSNDKVDVDMMSVTSGFVVYSDDTLQAQVLELPYTGEQLKMVIVLPSEKDGLSKTIQNMRGIPKPSSNAYASKYVIYVPKFKITSEMTVDAMIKSFGVTEAFSEQPDFSKLSARKTRVDKIKQKAFIEVNEEGTEAAAVTGGSFIPAPAPIFIPPVFRVDHPFLYFIVHVPTDTALFAGYVLKP